MKALENTDTKLQTEAFEMKWKPQDKGEICYLLQIYVAVEMEIILSITHVAISKWENSNTEIKQLKIV